MKRAKDRLHKVIVIGATPAGIAATNKLGELGIPVTLVDSSPTTWTRNFPGRSGGLTRG